MMDMGGMAVLAFAGLGAIAGVLVMAPLAVVGIWNAEVWAWVWVPPVLGTAIGLFLGVIANGR